MTHTKTAGGIVAIEAEDSIISRDPGMKEQSEKSQGSVLVMDDEEIVRKVCADILKTYGYEVECVPDGRAAVEQYERRFRKGNSFDGVILDLVVPGGMGGKEVVRKILNIDPSAKVLITSGCFNDPAIADYASFGFCGLLPKPYSVKTLTDAVQGMISGCG